MIIYQVLTTMLLPALLSGQMALGALHPTSAAPAQWSVYQQHYNLASLPTPSNLPAPSPFRRSQEFDTESPSSHQHHHRVERKLSGYSYSTLQQGAVAESLHNALELNPHAQSINAELERAFASVASYHADQTQPEAAHAALTAATNDLNVDQSPTGAIVPFDWHRYFTTDSQPQQQPAPIESSADEVYQAKRSREELNKSL